MWSLVSVKRWIVPRGQYCVRNGKNDRYQAPIQNYFQNYFAESKLAFTRTLGSKFGKSRALIGRSRSDWLFVYVECPITQLKVQINRRKANTRMGLTGSSSRRGPIRRTGRRRSPTYHCEHFLLSMKSVDASHSRFSKLSKIGLIASATTEMLAIAR